MNTPRVLRGNREHRWRCANAHVSVVDGARPLDGIANPDSRRLGPGPEFEVLGPIVVAHAVDVVNRLTFDQVPPEQTLCDQDVFEERRDFVRPGDVREPVPSRSQPCVGCDLPSSSHLPHRPRSCSSRTSQI